ncbi:MAG: hypothetical protein M3R27_11775 [Bacteroidota bacterium]|nr:hypothetical protein [Bacteroidota bacterium]
MPVFLNAQQNLPLNRQWSLPYKKKQAPVENSNDKDTTTGGHVVNGIYPGIDFGSVFKPSIRQPFPQKKDKSQRWLKRKVKSESFILVNDSTDRFNLAIDPLLNFEFGTDFADKTHEALYKNTRGFLARGSIGEKFVFESSFYENQSTFVKYIDNYIIATDDLFPQTANYKYNVVPGQGRSKAFKTNGYDYAMASAYISYTPFRMLNVQVGHGKHFVGDGYRSLLLSDNSFNYPYARITTTYKNIQYTNLYTSFMNLSNAGVKTPPSTERLFQKKTGSFQMLTVDLWKRLQLGLFQGMIWQAADTNNRQHVSFNTFDPVIGVNALVYGMHHENNILMGATFRLKIAKSISLYGQYMMDDVYSSKDKGDVRKKNGYQVGFKYYNLFTIRNLHIQAEYNSVRPYAYAAENPLQSYTHYNQALAHPMGANFKEFIGFLNYRLFDFFIEIKANYAEKGTDTLSNNFGGNIFRSDNVFPLTQKMDDIYTTQGLKTYITYQDVHIGYLVNPVTNLNIYVGFSNRVERTDKSTANTQFVYLGIRTSLANFYYDF